MSPTKASGDSAPTYSVPRERIVSIEHPCVIHDFPNAFHSLGGEQQLKHLFEHTTGDSTDVDVKQGVEPIAGVSLRPSDPLAKKIPSSAVPTQNVLVKVTLPKLIGRKRKRGSDEPFRASSGQQSNDQACNVTAQHLLQRMRDNAGHVKIETIGSITDTHPFNNLPDFQVQAEEVPIMREIRHHLMHPDYEKLKAFSVDVKPQPGQPTAFPGPPSFATSKRPVVRKVHRPDPPAQYQPPSLIPIELDTTPEPTPLPSRLSGDVRAPPPKLRDILINPLTTPIPRSPPSTLLPPPPNSLVSILLTTLRRLLTTRPILPRRTYWSRLQPHADKYIRRALPHAVYYLDTTPWRYSVVAYGVDPRSDARYAPYQTISFSKPICAAIKAGSAYGSPSHHLREFDGTTSVDPTEIWALADFTEPLLASLIHTTTLRNVCDDTWGWYFNGTLAKILVIAKEKMTALANPGRDGNLGEDEYGVLAGLPDVIEKVGEGRVWGGRVAKLVRAVEEEALRPTFGNVRGFEETAGVGRGFWGVGRGVGVDGAGFSIGGVDEGG